MKKFIFGWMFVAAAFAAGPAAADFDNMTGADWGRMTETHKGLFIYTGIVGLERQGVFIHKAADFYIGAMDSLLELDPEMKAEPLDNLFVFAVYEHEPHTQKAIDKILDEQMKRPEA